MKAVLLCVVLVCGARAQTLGARIEALIRATPGASQAFWGIKAVDPARGRMLVSINADRLFRPASNAKLFTSAFALERLGPEYELLTTVISDGRPDADGRIAGDVSLVGGGDPSLSGGVYPYQYGAPARDPLAALDELAAQVAAQGVRVIDGDIVGDGTAYEWMPYPEGWTLDDSLWLYGAPVSALSVSDSSIRLTLRPGPPGLAPVLELAPPVEYFAIDNRVRWGPGLARDLLVERTGGRLRLSGTMPPATSDLLLAVDEPALFAAYAFRDALLKRGIAVTGRPLARHRRPGEPFVPRQGFELARRISPPLLELLRVIVKVSQNLHTEMIYREAGRRGHDRKAFLTGIGIPEADYSLEDGSGLARQNMVTPNAVMSLLLYMHNSPHREAWVSLMPVGATDGTLDDRFAVNPAAARRVHAKTGTLGGVSALSGYIDRRAGGRIAFTILVNNYTAESKAIRGVMDRIALLLASAAG